MSMQNSYMQDTMSPRVGLQQEPKQSVTKSENIEQQLSHLSNAVDRLQGICGRICGEPSVANQVAAAQASFCLESVLVECPKEIMRQVDRMHQYIERMEKALF